MKKYLLNSLLFIALQTNAQDLPGRHQLTKNDLGEYYVINHENLTMIEPSILKIGFSGRWILACIKSRGAYDSIDKKKWIYFSDEAFPELKDIKLENLSDEKCP